jgi:hypothetical protein
LDDGGSKLGWSWKFCGTTFRDIFATQNYKLLRNFLSRNEGSEVFQYQSLREFQFKPKKNFICIKMQNVYACSPLKGASTLQMKDRWECLVPIYVSQKWNCYFQNRIKMFCLPVPTLIYLWEIYIFPRSVYLLFCREICGPILGLYKALTDTWMWELGLRLRNSQKRNR